MMGAAFLLPIKKGQAQDVPPIIIKATTIFTPPDNGDDPNPPQETNTVIYVKGAHIKSESKSETQHTIVIIDRDAKKTTQLYEQGGRKYGYYAIDTPHTPKVRTDSAGNPLPRPRTNLDYQDSTKVIAGLTCKKAVATTNFGGRTVTTVIWYTKELPLKQPLPTGGRFNLGGMNTLDGFPVAYTTTLPNGAMLQYQISKVDQNATINDNTFDIPKGYDIKPESERPQFNFQGGGGFRGGPGGGGPGGGGGQ